MGAFIMFKFLMRNGVFPAISVNKYVTVISDTCPQKCKFLSPRHNQEGEQYLPNMAAIRLQPLPMVSTEELKLLKKKKKKKTGNWPQIAEMHMKEVISVSPDSCIFPYIEKQ